MAYPPPPGLNKAANLPQKPPPPANPAPAAAPSSSSNRTKPAFTAFTGFAPRSVSTAQQPAPAAPSYNSSQYQQNGSHYNNGSNYNTQYAHQQQTAPDIKNPFLPTDTASALANRGFNTMTAEEEAQMLQWQSAYVTRDEKRVFPTTISAGPQLSAQEMSSAANARSDVASVVTGADGKQKTVIRKGGGQTWQDPSLLEWDPAHFRLFVGNLAGEVTDESLIKAFSKYGSVQKARVIRDKRTTKSKGFGFVSFSDGDEYFKAAKEMQGKYIGSHPVLLRKSTTEIKATTPKEQRRGRNGEYHSHNGGGGHGYQDRTGSGVQKKQSKTKGGLKILG